MMTRWWPGCGKRSKVLCGKRRCPPTRRSSLSPTWCQATTRSGSHLAPTHSSDHRKLSVFLRSSNKTVSRPPSLTVTDSDGATNSTQATLAVYKAKDYRPVANAGPSPVRLFPIQIAHSDLRCHKKLNGVWSACRSSSCRKTLSHCTATRAPTTTTTCPMSGPSAPRARTRWWRCRWVVDPSLKALHCSKIPLTNRLHRFHYSGRADTDPAAVRHARGRLHLPADRDGLLRAAGHGPRHRYRAAR